MGDGGDPTIEAIVAKFFAARRRGERRSIDEILDAFPELERHPEVRATALRSIALQSRNSRSGDASVSRLPRESDAAVDPPPDVLPELEGYDLIDRVGHGGMGVVYEAYQQSTGRRVAVKFMLEAARVTESARRRFEREVELVARLDHPGIVSVLDSGVHHGRYFYVMEFVNGRPLDEAFPPGLGDRTRLLEVGAAMCDVVDYAHQRGVLHRDLKPSNILIDIRGQPRLLDFGLAKAIDPPSEGGTGKFRQTLSEPGQLIGTLAYMSPEQSLGELGEVSVRSDVYSLGAILYELLTGRLPCPVDGPAREVLEAIVNRDPPPPSAILKARMADLDAVVLKALEKDPSARYASASEFAEDLRRVIADEPVSARRAGPLTRSSRWVRRNRRVSIVAAGALVAIIGVTAAAFVGVTGERDRAESIKGYLEKMFTSFDPDRASGEELRIRAKMLDEAWASIKEQIPQQSDVEASIRMIVGRAYYKLSEFETQKEHLEKVVAIERGRFADPSEQLAVSTYELARACYWLGELARAEDLYAESLRMRVAIYGEQSLQACDGRNGIAGCRWKRSEAAAESGDNAAQLADLRAAEELYRQVLGIRERARDEARAATGTRSDQELRRLELESAAAMNNLGRVLVESGQFEEGARLIRGALERIRRLASPAPKEEASAMHTLGQMLFQQGDYAEAEAQLSRALELRRRFLASDHYLIATTERELARVLAALGRIAEARDLCVEAIRIFRSRLPAGHRDIGRAQRVLDGLGSDEPRSGG